MRGRFHLLQLPCPEAHHHRGEGGAVVWRDFDNIDNDLLERRLALLGDHGQTGKNISGIHGREWEYDIALFGYNHIMTDVDAAAGLGQLDRMKELYSAREALTKLYYLNLPGSVGGGSSALWKGLHQLHAPVPHPYSRGRRE